MLANKAKEDHIIPLYLIPVAVTLRVARTLQKRLMSEVQNFNTQFTYVFRHPGA